MTALPIPTLALAAALIFAAASGCSSGQRGRPPARSACGSGSEVSLCATADGAVRVVNRLSDSAAERDRAIGNRATGLVALPVPERVVELRLQPAESLRLVEITLYRSVRALGREPPLESVECAPACGRWGTTVSHSRRTVRIPAADARSGRVLIVAAFAQTELGVQQISWGVVFRTPIG